jgi:tetratricopeptide (TPR) repeat protein
LGLAEALTNQGLIQYLLGDFPQAVATHLRAESVLAGLVPTYGSRLALANAQKQLGVVYHFVGKPAEGLTKTRAAIQLYQALVREQPDDQNVRFQLALAIVNAGNYARQSDPDGAIARYREALALIAALRSEAPAQPRYSQWGAVTTSNLGLMLSGSGKTDAAIAALREAVALATQVSDEFLRLDAGATCRNNLGEALEQAKRLTEAETVFRQSLGDYRALASRFPNDVDYRWGVAMTATSLANVLLQQNRPKEARDLIEESAKLYDDIAKKLGTNADFHQNHEEHKRVRNAIRQRASGNEPK